MNVSNTDDLAAALARAQTRISELEAELSAHEDTRRLAYENEQMLRLVIESIPQRIFWKDRDCVFLGCNGRILEDAGLSNSEDFIGKTDHDMPWASNADAYIADDREVMEADAPKLHIVEQLVDAEGETKWLETNKMPLHDRDGQVVGIIGTFEDITTRKRAEEALRTHRDQLEQEVAARIEEQTALNEQLQEEVMRRVESQGEQALLQAQVIETQRLAIAELSSPVIPLLDDILVMPLIGNIDSSRAREIMRAVLAAISTHRAKVVILDITGVSVVDSGVAAHLNKTMQAARLKGARTIITGISDAVAETIVDLGIDWSDLDTLSDLQTGLLAALDARGFKLIHTTS